MPGDLCPSDRETSTRTNRGRLVICRPDRKYRDDGPQVDSWTLDRGNGKFDVSRDQCSQQTGRVWSGWVRLVPRPEAVWTNSGLRVRPRVQSRPLSYCAHIVFSALTFLAQRCLEHLTSSLLVGYHLHNCKTTLLVTFDKSPCFCICAEARSRTGWRAMSVDKVESDK